MSTARLAVLASPALLLCAASLAQVGAHPALVDNLPPAPALDNGETLWPQAAVVDGVAYVLYSPQFESIVGTTASARAAFSATPAGGSPAYGSMRFDCAVGDDLAAGVIHVSDMQVRSAALSSGGDASKPMAVLQQMLMGADFTVQRASALENMQLSAMSPAAGRVVPGAMPAIRVVDRPTVALVLDGPPVLREVAPGVGIARNAGSLLAFDAGSGTWFTRVGTSTWLQSSSYRGPWVGGAAPSAAAAAAIEAALLPRAPGAPAPTIPAPGRVPDVITCTDPRVIVSIDGAPDLAQVADGLYAVRNCGSELFTDGSGASWWLLASGRWFTSKDLVNGPWTPMRASALPPSFAAIDPRGTWGGVLAAVPGTAAAKDAAYQQQVPHVATLDRAKAQASVSFVGGAPRMQPVDGTGMTIAANATWPVIGCEGAFYLCQDAAWFTAPAATGPWTLCDAVPEAIYALPPASPTYPVTFVRVLNATADAVTFSYTAGYANSFFDGDVVVFGTGASNPGLRLPVPAGGAAAPGDDAIWGDYVGAPITFGLPMSFGYAGWTCQSAPGWSEYDLQGGPAWSAGGWWGPGLGFDTGHALAMGFGGAWGWGHHPWGTIDGDGWWQRHWGAAYRRGWSGAMRAGNRAATPGVPAAAASAPTAATPDSSAGASPWRHAGGADDDVVAGRDGRVYQQRGRATYARGADGWHATSSDGDAPASAADGPGFREQDGSAAAAASARQASMDGFRPDPNHNFDGSPRGAFARGETNYADRREGLEPPQSGGPPDDYRRGGSWNGGGWDRREAPAPAQAQGGAPMGQGGYGNAGWQNGERGYGRYSGYTGARGIVGGYNDGWSKFGGDPNWSRFSGGGVTSGYTGGIYAPSGGPARSGYSGGGMGVNNSMFGWGGWGMYGGGYYGGNYRYGNFVGGMPMGIIRR
jgi:hypothetical protein